jgi:RHS repeat-associated protein
VGRLVNGTLVSGWLYQDQLRPVAQLDGTGTNVVARFVYGSKSNVPDYMITSGGTYRILSDHLGSPRLVVDANSGAIIETINFDEFGNETDTLATTLPTGYVRLPFGFAGGIYDPDTGLVRFGARDYDASVGRWTSKDPILFDGGQNNIYVYAANDPINVQDTDGTRDWGPLGGTCCNTSGNAEWALVGSCQWAHLNPGQCTLPATDCDGLTCNGSWLHPRNFDAGTCSSSGLKETGPLSPIGRQPWSPACGPSSDSSDAVCPGSGTPPGGYPWSNCCPAN